MTLGILNATSVPQGEHHAPSQTQARVNLPQGCPVRSQPSPQLGKNVYDPDQFASAGCHTTGLILDIAQDTY